MAINPFGILFEEQDTDFSLEGLVPQYDPVEQISFITDSTGKRVPYVIGAWEIFGTQTGMVTRKQYDITDTDPGDDSPYSLIFGTQTVTKIKNESTDAD